MGRPNFLRPESIGRGRYTCAPPASAARTYSTSFGATENPVSESGNWRTNACAYFKDCQTAGGRIHGNQPQFQNGGNYEDAYAHLAGTWAANQRIEGIIYKASPSGYQEAELHLRGSDGANFVKAIEVYVHQSGGYFSAAIWRGDPLSTTATIAYFDLLPVDTFNITPPADGDTMWAQIVGNLLSAGINSTTYINNFDISPYTAVTSGSPGIGFDNGGSGSEGFPSQFGFKDFYVTELP